MLLLTDTLYEDSDSHNNSKKKTQIRKSSNVHLLKRGKHHVDTSRSAVSHIYKSVNALDWKSSNNNNNI